MMPLIVIRPQPGCDSTVSAARAQGLDAHGFPLFHVRPVAWDVPVANSVDAVLIGSANALRHGGSGLAVLAGKPAFVVGETTAKAARSAGLDVVEIGRGTLQPVVNAIPAQHRRLLRLAGRERITLIPPAGATIEERIVYASDSLPMPPELASLLRDDALVMLHSAVAARHFAAECDRYQIMRGAITLACIGPRVAEAAGSGWKTCESAAEANDSTLLAMAAELCQDSAAMKRGSGKS